MTLVIYMIRICGLLPLYAFNCLIFPWFVQLELSSLKRSHKKDLKLLRMFYWNMLRALVTRSIGHWGASGSSLSRIKWSLSMWDNLYWLHPLAFRISIIHCWCVRNTLFKAFRSILLNESSTAWIRSSIVFAAVWCCNDWIALKYPQSGTLVSGLFGSWKPSLTSKTSCFNSLVAALNSASSGSQWGPALWALILKITN